MTISACLHAVTEMTQFSSPSVLSWVLRWIPEVNRLDLFAIMRCFETDLYLFGCVRWCIGPWPYGTGAHTDQHSAKCVENAWFNHTDSLLPLPVLSVPFAGSHLLGPKGKEACRPPKKCSNGARRQITSGWRRVLTTDMDGDPKSYSAWD